MRSSSTACKIVAGKLTGDEPDGDTNDQVDGLEDQLVHPQSNLSSEK